MFVVCVCFRSGLTSSHGMASSDIVRGYVLILLNIHIVCILYVYVIDTSFLCHKCVINMKSHNFSSIINQYDKLEEIQGMWVLAPIVWKNHHLIVNESKQEIKLHSTKLKR